jgi:hypothetical protein
MLSKRVGTLRALWIFIFLITCGKAMGAEESLPTTEELMKVDSSAKQFSQLFSVQAGMVNPRSVAISNGDYDFQYGGKGSSSTMVEVGWSIKLFEFLGSWHLEEGLNYMNFSGTANYSIRGTTETPSLRLNVLGLDTRFMYSMDWFPWKRMVPFLDGGYQVSFYSQSSTSDLESASGSSGNFVGGAGLRFWLNRGNYTNGDFVSHVESIPIFLTVKYNHIFPNHLGLDLASDSYLAGLQLGL